MSSHVNDNRAAWYAATGDAKNSLGKLWRSGTIGISITPGTPYVFGMVTADIAMALDSFELTTLSLDTDIKIYEGGTITGGTPMFTTAMNRTLIKPFPVASFNEGVTVSAAGTLIFEMRHRNPATDEKLAQIVTAGRNSTLVLAANQTYYLEIDNLDAAAKEYDGSFLLTTFDD
jgi:hypothetical protein